MLFVKDPAANAGLAVQFATHTVDKTYLALTGRPPRLPPKAWRSDAMVEDRPAVTDFVIAEVLARGLLVEAHPRTGRKHQVRVHLADAGLPIFGDRRYGGETGVGARVMLHAARLALRHPLTNAPLSVESPLPADFRAVLEGLRGACRPGRSTSKTRALTSSARSAIRPRRLEERPQRRGGDTPPARQHRRRGGQRGRKRPVPASAKRSAPCPLRTNATRASGRRTSVAPARSARARPAESRGRRRRACWSRRRSVRCSPAKRTKSAARAREPETTMRRRRARAAGAISPGSLARAEVRIGVEPRSIDGAHDALQEPGHEIVLGRSAEADGIGEALLEGDAMMGNPRRQVQHVARAEHPLLLRAEVAQDAQVEAGHVVLGEALGHAPPAAPAPLQEEHVVAVHVGSDGAQRRGQADHHVVDAPAGQEVEALDQIRHGSDVGVHVLDEHGPVGRPERAREPRRQGPSGELPPARTASLTHQAGLDVRPGGEGQEARGSEGIAKAGHRAAHEQRTLLPVPPEEGLRAQPSEERRYFSRTGRKSRSW